MSFYSINRMKFAESTIKMCLFYIWFYLSRELCWRLTTRMIAVFIIMYSMTNMVFPLPNLFQLCSEWRHHSCQMAIMSALCSFTSELSTALILLTPVTKQQNKNRQKETKERMWDHGTGKTNQGEENREVLPKPAGAPVHYRFMWAGLRHRATSSASDEAAASLSPLSSLTGTPKKQAQPPEPPGGGQGAGWEFGTEHLLCWSFSQASCASRVSSRFYFHIFAEHITLLNFFYL